MVATCWNGRGYSGPLWIRRVLVRAQEGQLGSRDAEAAFFSGAGQWPAVLVRVRDKTSSLTALTALDRSDPQVLDWRRLQTDQGTPGESRGRKATGPRLLRDAGV